MNKTITTAVLIVTCGLLMAGCSKSPTAPASDQTQFDSQSLIFKPLPTRIPFRPFIYTQTFEDGLTAGWTGFDETYIPGYTIQIYPTSTTTTANAGNSSLFYNTLLDRENTPHFVKTFSYQTASERQNFINAKEVSFWIKCEFDPQPVNPWLVVFLFRENRALPNSFDSPANDGGVGLSIKPNTWQQVIIPCTAVNNTSPLMTLELSPRLLNEQLIKGDTRKMRVYIDNILVY